MSEHTHPGTDLVTMSWPDWSCTMTVTARARELDVAVTVVDNLLAEVDEAVSRFRDDSDLARVNAAAGRYVAVRPLTLRLVALARQVAHDTGGAIDPTLGGDLIAHGYDADIDVVRERPAVPGVPRLRPHSWRDVRVDTTFRRIGVPAGVTLDLGATAKAWTADEAVRRLRRRLRGPALVSLGGDLAVLGAPDLDGWQVDVAERAGDPAQRVAITSGALATSSTRGRRWQAADGTERHHVIDPRTGAPAQGRWRTATVWAPTALTANVMSTWLLVDADAAEATLAERGYAARLVAADGTVDEDRCARTGWPAHQAAS